MSDDSQGNDNTSCVVCFKNSLYYSIGECDHPVCFECSTRMRVLCLQNECPICRGDLGRVVFTETVQLYKELCKMVIPDKLFERQFKIGFCDDRIKSAYEKLLENRCKFCPKIPPFRSFNGLSDHMRKTHEKYYCDLCVKHLKIFTSERKCYTRQELAHHRRKGDLDDTSHRGHPLCEFCEERFMDADELYRHLRKEHLYCHLCDADGRNYYYATHTALAQHFRTEHFLCEEGECAGEHLTAVFRSDIDLIAHKASVHGKGLAKAAARQARTLELQFNIAPHPNVTHQRQGQGHTNNRVIELPPNPPPAPAPRIDTRSDQDFPRLSTAAPTPILCAGPDRTYNRGGAALARTDRNFPALSGGNPPRANAGPAKPPPPVSASLRSSKPSLSIQLHSQPASASNFRLTQPTGNRISIPQQQKRTPLSDDDFPTLGNVPMDNNPSLGAATPQPPKVTMINSQEMQALKKGPSQQQAKKPQLANSEAFPALSSSSAPSAPPQWIKVAKPKDKKQKPEPPPPKEPNFNPVADFPSLPGNGKSKAKKAHPAPQLDTKQTNSKKENKKTDDAKKENSKNNENKSPRDAASVLTSMNNNDLDRKSKSNGGNGDFKLGSKDYPPLSGKVNGGVNAPPGFSKVPACNGMTFTNSSGQTFSAPVHKYIPPPNFEDRNKALVKKFAVALGGTEAVEDFKVASRAFRSNQISAEEFYRHCQMAMGSQLQDVFPELVALLPDIGKQQELVVGVKGNTFLSICNNCGQLLAKKDTISHESAHWPALNGN